LLLGPQGETRKLIVTNSTIIDDIATTIRTQKQLPLFVAEGTAMQKMRRINSVPYLRTAYQKIAEIVWDNLNFWPFGRTERPPHI
jgi:Domain of unknown function (DUF4917)